MRQKGAGEGLDEEPTLEPGSLIAGKYEVVRLLGRGGMGLVYEARHKRLDHRVAIKMLSEEVSHLPDVVRRFDQEARAAAQLRGRHVARVHDVDSLENGAPFIVMEYLEGRDLADEISARGAIPVGEAVLYMLDVCEGMSEAHKLGIVHRDLKPANLFLSKGPDGPMIKVLDFGISKLSKDPNAIVTGSQAIFGSPHYMSPEQVRSATDVDARSDIWSLGVILYELLAGDPPFQGRTPSAIIAAIIADTPQPLGEGRPYIPEALSTAVMKALARDPNDRYETAAEFAQAIAPFAATSRSVRPPPPTRQLVVSRSAVTGEAPDSRAATKLALPHPDDLESAPPTSAMRRPSLRTWPIFAIAATLIAGVGVAIVTTQRASEPGVASAAGAKAATPDSTSAPVVSTSALPTAPSAEAVAPTAEASVASTSESEASTARPGFPRDIHERPRAPVETAAPAPVASAPPPVVDTAAPASSSGKRRFRTNF